MTAYSLPPSDRDTAEGDPNPGERPVTIAEAPQPVAVKSQYPERDPAVYAMLRNYIDQFPEEQRPTYLKISRQIGFSESVIGQYMMPNGNRYPGNIKKVERHIRQFIGSEQNLREHKSKLIESPETRTILRTFELIKNSSDVGVIFGPAGLGKTSACQIWAAEDPTAIFITLDQWNKGPDAIEDKIWDLVPTKSYHSWLMKASRKDRDPDDGQGVKLTTRTRVRSKMEFLAIQLAGSRRLIIVDNAHKMTPAAAQRLFDFHDATECPLALIGNPELMTVIEASDQRFSRVGIREDLTPIPNPDRLVRHLIASFAPRSGEELVDACKHVASEQGHYRAVKKQLMLTQAMMQTVKPGEATWMDVFRAAHKKLIRGYDL